MLLREQPPVARDRLVHLPAPPRVVGRVKVVEPLRHRQDVVEGHGDIPRAHGVEPDAIGLVRDHEIVEDAAQPRSHRRLPQRRLHGGRAELRQALVARLAHRARPQVAPEHRVEALGEGSAQPAVARGNTD